MDTEVVENVIAFEVPAVESDDVQSVTTMSPPASAGRSFIIFNLAARRPIAYLYGLWTNYFPRGAVGEDLFIPGSTLKFVIGGLLSFAEIKSQGKTGFPFQTHPQAMMVAVTSLLIYGFASAVEHVLSAARIDRIVDYARIARFGRVVCLYMLDQRALRMKN